MGTGDELDESEHPFGDDEAEVFFLSLFSFFAALNYACFLFSPRFLLTPSPKKKKKKTKSGDLQVSEEVQDKAAELGHEGLNAIKKNNERYR